MGGGPRGLSGGRLPGQPGHGPGSGESSPIQGNSSGSSPVITSAGTRGTSAQWCGGVRRSSLGPQLAKRLSLDPVPDSWQVLVSARPHVVGGGGGSRRRDPGSVHVHVRGWWRWRPSWSWRLVILASGPADPQPRDGPAETSGYASQDKQ